jgi:hypothetical protein
MRTTEGQGQMPAIGEPTDSNSPAHPLDNVIWGALTSRNRNFADGDDLALRFPAPIAPFAAMIDRTTASFQSLGALLPTGDQIALFTVGPPTGWLKGLRQLLSHVKPLRFPRYDRASGSSRGSRFCVTGMLASRHQAE